MIEKLTKVQSDSLTAAIKGANIRANLSNQCVYVMRATRFPKPLVPFYILTQPHAVYAHQFINRDEIHIIILPRSHR